MGCKVKVYSYLLGCLSIVSNTHYILTVAEVAQLNILITQLQQHGVDLTKL